jgi:hypothetical protein
LGGRLGRGSEKYLFMDYPSIHVESDFAMKRDPNAGTEPTALFGLRHIPTNLAKCPY